MSILNPGIRIFPANLQKFREIGRMLRRTMIEKNGESTPGQVVSTAQEFPGAESPEPSLKSCARPPELLWAYRPPKRFQQLVVEKRARDRRAGQVPFLWSSRTEQ